MPATYEKIASTTLNSAASGIEFTSIPNTYTDLKISFKSHDVAGNPVAIRFNSDSGSNYSTTFLYVSANTPGSYRYSSATKIVLANSTGTSTIPIFNEIDIFSYASSNYKTLLNKESGANSALPFMSTSVGLWRSTSAITTIRLEAGFSGSNLGAGSTATIYGILRA